MPFSSVSFEVYEHWLAKPALVVTVDQSEDGAAAICKQVMIGKAAILERTQKMGKLKEWQREREGWWGRERD